WDNWSNLASTSEWPYDSWPEALRASVQGSGNAAELVVPAGHFFVMGDNRSVGGSEDSRVFGPVRADEIAGRATFVWWPPVTRAEDGSIKLNWRLLPRPPGFQNLQ
ncbi:MAG TPA: signal peptidase I, partial [Deinococcales bacterium]|nr:signal peptidase I [Deinococcales bacterium]